MTKARLLTIGTEITSGEVINSNAAWISRRLEDLGVRVYSHLTVRDQRTEILKALAWTPEDEILIVTGGLGPTSDDLTRECVASYAGRALEFDEQAWTALEEVHRAREIPLRPNHRHQCYFPAGSERLANPVGTALGFALKHEGQSIYVLPGPPRELAGMWTNEVEPRLRGHLVADARRWVRWTCLGVPESEVAERVEEVIGGRDIEVGYRATIPYVKVKVYVDPAEEAALITQIGEALESYVVAHDDQDLAEELLERWPHPELHVVDHVTQLGLVTRLFGARRAHADRGVRVPEVLYFGAHTPGDLTSAVVLRAEEGELVTEVHFGARVETKRQRLPFKLKLESERGRRSATEWAIWHVVRTLRAAAL